MKYFFAILLALMLAGALPVIAESVETEAPETVETIETAEPTETTEPAETTEAALPPETIPGVPVITKNPTDEHVFVGGYCEFVARADYAKEIIWYIISPDQSRKVLAQNGDQVFHNLWVTGVGTERLGINYIPEAMNGWRIRAEFVGETDHCFSADAYVYVDPLTPPEITVQPQSVTGIPGEPVKLQLRAEAPKKATVLYQWYESATDFGGEPIPGATDSTYTPEEIPGIRYYFCTVRSSSGLWSSTPTRSQTVSVIFPEPAQAEIPLPTEKPQPQPTVPQPLPEPTETLPETPQPLPIETATPTTEPEPTQATEPETTQSTEPETAVPIEPEHSSLLLPIGIAFFVFLVIGVTALVILVCREGQ